ncbi:protease inhibitor I42 family protein [uncultured Methanoregula sp.]|uniref:protease inhibitor I42 family protein n=1 Tax=uncultured Methanoregula sp. TaxID=1005933 RepID=UPI002AAB2734|nr:protease inhibitor I42 family protein [uncultured Methanoregula sp.]
MTESSRTVKIGPGLIGLLIVLSTLALISGCTQTTPSNLVTPAVTSAPISNLPNPASAACAGSGGSVDIKKNADGSEYGMCTFTNGTSCEEWALFRGEGCTGNTNATAVPATGGKKMVTLTQADNGRTSDIAQGTRFAVELAENPTTGFMWNATVSPGLVIQSSDFSQDPASKGLVGAGGTRTWVIVAKDQGLQKFSATYMRSWEPVTGNETAYLVNIQVIKI